MIAEIRRVWPGEKRTTIIAKDMADGKEQMCYVFLPEGQFIAALCQNASWNGVIQPPAIVLTLEPKTQWGYKITGAELMAETRNRPKDWGGEPDAHEPQPIQVAGDTQSYADDFERLYGHAGQIGGKVYDK